MPGFNVSQASTQRYPGGPIVPGVWRSSLPQNEAAGPLMSGNYDLLPQHNPPSFPSYVPRDGYYQPPSPVPSTSAVRTGHSGDETSVPVSVFSCQVGIML